MNWFEIVLNGAIFVALVAGVIAERKWTNRINKRLDGMNVKLNSVSRTASDAKVNSLDARREARQVKYLVNEQQVIVGGKLPDTPRNRELVERLRTAAERVSAKRAHPAGKGIVQTTESGVSFVPTEATKGVSE
ncbi:hypothetical protein SEA_MOLIVIA_78 [Arthrobacter phage Molivia]|uniref:Uncharacterized protein n=1 Tax=Arthrobacter phage Molivia TaxID=2015839 RepID=A0A286S1T8_9CAUD|nr:hypothetical protein FDI28_gp38 [Arthrobacter phage Molivia]ASX99299.1 hypothetical protein SEA_MOLIVIA_78 [Arthrobacter phage Molivia]